MANIVFSADSASGFPVGHVIRKRLERGGRADGGRVVEVLDADPQPVLLRFEDGDKSVELSIQLGERIAVHAYFDFFRRRHSAMVSKITNTSSTVRMIIQIDGCTT